MNTGFRAPSDYRTNPPLHWRVGQAAAHLSGPQHRLVTSTEVAAKVPVGASTVTDVLHPLTTVALFERTRGKYAVTEAGWAIFRVWQEDQTQARLLLQGQFLRHAPATAAWQALRDAPVDRDVLARRLHQSLPGKQQGQHLVDWLVTALLAYQDEDLRIFPAPALAAASSGRPAAEAPLPAPDALLGLTNRELREFPPSRYCAVLDGLTRILEHAAGTP